MEIMAQGNEAVAQYFEDLERQGEGKLNEAKLIIVGEPNAGKSSLMECLLDSNYVLDKDKKSTMGIDVKPWNFMHPTQNQREIRANIWDFGGQEIQYMTHQFFLTPNSLYLLVTTNDRTNSTNFPYWFKIINLLGEEKQRYSPVLVVKNRKNDEKHKQFRFDFDKTEYQKAYPHLQIEVLEVDLDNRKGDFQALQEKIIKMTTRLPIVNDPRPAMWSTIRKALIALNTNHINYEQFSTICSENDTTLALSQEILSRSLHHTGSILHFIDDTALADFIILNPQWAVDALYSVLKYAKIDSDNGRFTTQDLASIWSAYSPNERAKLFNLMKKDNFEICYPLLDTPDTFIAPQFLPNSIPKYPFDANDTLKFQFQYSFMPYGIITRLIVRLSAYIYNELVSQKGVIISKDGCMARIIQNQNRQDGLKVIEIDVWGDVHQRKFLLYTIRSEIKDIHDRWFKNIAVEEMIPCNCSRCKGVKSHTSSPTQP
ncbi:MAG: 50S ribosome-binding GTPase [Campylobacterales bacterium]|nr:50S ribosome-binding GTPase [Campylobacterales bacterium]